MYAHFCSAPTPLLRLAHISRVFGANLFLKMETCNPYGNAWMRHALDCLGQALARGDVRASGHVVDAADAGMALGLALAANALDLRLTLCLPSGMRAETADLLRSAGAALRIAKGGGMRAATAEARALENSCWYSFRPDIFTNPDAENACARMGGEILEQLEPAKAVPDAFVAAVASGATLAGAGRALLSAAPGCRIVAVVPEHVSSLPEDGATPAGAHACPDDLRAPLARTRCHETITVFPDEASLAARKLFAHEGLPGGRATGGVLEAMTRLAGRPEFKGKTIVGVARDNWAPVF